MLPFSRMVRNAYKQGFVCFNNGYCALKYYNHKIIDTLDEYDNFRRFSRPSSTSTIYCMSEVANPISKINSYNNYCYFSVIDYICKDRVMHVFFEDLDGAMNIYGIDDILSFSAHFKDNNTTNCMYN